MKPHPNASGYLDAIQLWPAYDDQFVLSLTTSGGTVNFTLQDKTVLAMASLFVDAVRHRKRKAAKLRYE